ncbi:hypothetical protein NQ318_014310 [Aromia moschata]|uniref:Uncharacterized protein n=1 Tax=Aromia moschata TaxID=1265417 RepID=A0AAV8YZ99_9CUCU|nr:hypothetical protein NQ318_014310 [Aromia moschata]
MCTFILVGLELDLEDTSLPTTMNVVKPTNPPYNTTGFSYGVLLLRGQSESTEYLGKFVKLACLWITEVIHVLVRCAQLKELLLLPKVCVKTQEPQLATT